MVFCVSFTCESFLVALTVLQLMTASRDPALRGDAAEEEAERLRGDIIVTSLSFLLTCAAFAATLAMQVLLALRHALAPSPTPHSAATAVSRCTGTTCMSARCACADVAAPRTVGPRSQHLCVTGVGVSSSQWRSVRERLRPYLCLCQEHAAVRSRPGASGRAASSERDRIRRLNVQVQRFRERVLAGGRVMHAQARRAVSFVARKSANLAKSGDGARARVAASRDGHASSPDRGAAAVACLDGAQEQGQLQLHADSAAVATAAQDRQAEPWVTAAMHADADAVVVMAAHEGPLVPAAAAEDRRG